MRIALATCSELPAHECDDEPLHAALVARGVELLRPQWDAPQIDWASFDAVILRTVWDYHAAPAAFVEWVDGVGACTQLFNPAPVVVWNSRKDYLRELEQRGVAIAPTRWLDAGGRHDLRELCSLAGIERGFLKPVVGANSQHTFRFALDDAQALAAAQAHLDAREASDPHAAMMLQPYLASVEREGEISAIYFDGAFSHGTRKLPAAGDYRVQDDWGARDEVWEPDAAAARLCERVLAVLAEIARERGWEGALPLLYARVDLLRDARGAWVLNELELIEPSLFFRHGPRAPATLADAIVRRLS